MNEKVLLLKLSEEDSIPLHDKEALKKRASGDWRITENKIEDVNKVLLLLHQTVIEEYSLGLNNVYHDGTRRITLDLKDVNNSQFKNLKISAPTANPASTMDLSDLEKNTIYK